MCQGPCQSSQPRHGPKGGHLSYPFYSKGNGVLGRLNHLPPSHGVALNLCVSYSSVHRKALMLKSAPKLKGFTSTELLLALLRARPQTSETPRAHLALSSASRSCQGGKASRLHRSPEPRALDPFPLVGNGPKLKTNTLK